MLDYILPKISGNALPLIKAYLKDKHPNKNLRITEDVLKNESTIVVEKVNYSEASLIDAFMEHVRKVPEYN